MFKEFRYQQNCDYISFLLHSQSLFKQKKCQMETVSDLFIFIVLKGPLLSLSIR